MNESAPFAMMRRMKNLSDRIRHVREVVLDLSQEDFAKLLGVTRGAVGNWELGKPIGRKNIVGIADKSGVRLDWLLTGKGPAPEAGNKTFVDPYGETFSVPNQGIKEIDSLAGLGGGQVAPTAYKKDGESLQVADAYKPEAWVFPRSFLDTGLKAPAKELIAIATQGDSMAPTINHGDVVFIDTRHLRISPSGIYALRDIYGEIIVKRLDAFREGDDFQVKITSDNPHEPTRIEPLSEVTIVGRVCGIMKLT